MLRPVRTVRATTKDEVDAALATADQVVVEGDDELLSYAANKASGDGSENQITIEMGVPKARSDEEVTRLVEKPGGTIKWFNPQKGYGFIQPTDGGKDVFVHIPAVERAGLGGLAPKPSAPPPAARGNKGIVAAVLAALIAIAGAIAWYLHLWLAAQRPRVVTQPDTAVGPLSPPSPLNPAARPPPASGWIDSSVLWPLVAIVAIIALFLIARQAISSGSNVTIQWKVTEKVSGRVVITKVRGRAPRQRAAA
jgi:CspA family cold shock protein